MEERTRFRLRAIMDNATRSSLTPHKRGVFSQISFTEIPKNPLWPGLSGCVSLQLGGLGQGGRRMMLAPEGEWDQRFKVQLMLSLLTFISIFNFFGCSNYFFLNMKGLSFIGSY